MWTPVTPVSHLGVAIAPGASSSAGSTATAIAPGTPGCCVKLSFPSTPSPMNEDREDPDIMHRTAFGVSGNSETVQQLAGDQFRNRFASASMVCLNGKKQRLSHSALPQDLSLFCDEDMSPEQVHVASRAKTVPRSKVGSGPKVALMLH
jgi:hypothetical protein